MKVIVKGVGPVELTQRNFLSKGGEGSIYAKGDTAYKVYDDNVPPIPYAKMQELSVLNHPKIINPDKLLTDNLGTPRGYTMRLLKDTYPLVQLFTKAFKQRNCLSAKDILALVKEFQEIVKFVHGTGILIVDLNEMNFLTDGNCKGIYAIDVNSYQTPSFPATVLMPSVRDHHAQRFSELSDWYSWGVVAFQMLVGIHPYKGNHPDFDAIPMDERMEARMKSNISVFNVKTKVPKVCEPFDSIPSSLRSWFESVFERGERNAPPSDYESVVYIVTPITQSQGKSFNINELHSHDSAVVGYSASHGTSVVITDNSVYVNKNILPFRQKNVLVCFTQNQNTPILAWAENGRVKLFDTAHRTELPITSSCDGIMVSGGRLYVQNGSDIVEVNFMEVGGKVIPNVKTVGQVLDLPDATKLFDGVVVQNLLGRQVVSIFPQSGMCQQVSLQTLDGYQVIDARYENNVLVVIGYRVGQYDRFVFLFDTHYAYDVREVFNVSYTGINMTVSDVGVCVLLNEEEKLEVFSNKKDSGTIKILDDPAIGSDMTLYHDGTKILFSKLEKLYSLSMR